MLKSNSIGLVHILMGPVELTVMVLFFKSTPDGAIYQFNIISYN